MLALACTTLHYGEEYICISEYFLSKMYKTTVALNAIALSIPLIQGTKEDPDLQNTTDKRNMVSLMLTKIIY